MQGTNCMHAPTPVLINDGSIDNNQKVNYVTHKQYAPSVILWVKITLKDNRIGKWSI